MSRKTTTPAQGAAAALPESAKKGAVTARSESDSKTKGNKIINQKAQDAIKLNQEQQPMTSATAPQDVFDCIAAGIPREQWGETIACATPAPHRGGRSMNTTTAMGFARIATQHPHLFQVNPDVPIVYALEQASLVLAAVHEMAEEVAQLDLGNDVWGMACLIEMAKAIVDSCSAGVSRTTGQEG